MKIPLALAPLDFILIHGYVLEEDGTMDPLLIDRLDYGRKVCSQGFTNNIVVAGKHGGRDQPFYERTGIPESSVMKDYLVSIGVPSGDIFEEDQGTNTFDSTLNAYNQFILPNGWLSGMVVSTAEHLPRIILQSQKIFSPEINLWYGGPTILDTSKREEFLTHEREAIAYTLSRSD
jgi:hypothetical protein